MPITTLEPAVALLGRLLLAAIFLHEAWSKIAGYDRAVTYMQAFGIPGALLPLAIVTELGCGLLVALGLYARLAALPLAGFCIVTALIFHTKFSSVNELLHFEKDFAIAGGFLMLYLAGPGSWSLDARLRGGDR